MAGGRRGEAARFGGAVCFDLSDTIVEWEAAFEAALREAFGEWVGRWSDRQAAAAAVDGAVRRYRRARREGMRRASAVRDAAEEMPIEADERTIRYIVRQCRRLQTERAGFADGAEETMRRLARRYRLAIVTNLPADDAAAIWRRLRLHRFVPERLLFAAGSGAPARKPDVLLFRYVSAQLGVPPHRCVMVGDSYRQDVAGALRAGWKAVWLRKRATRLRDPRVSAAPSLPGLPRLLRTLLEE